MKFIFDTARNLSSHLFGSGLDLTCSECGQVIRTVGATDDGEALEVFCLSCALFATLIERHPHANRLSVDELLNALSIATDRQQFATLMQSLKVALGCAHCSINFDNHALAQFAPRVFQFAHFDRATKLRSKSGRAIHPAKILPDGYSLVIAIVQMLVLSRSLCSNCHALETASE
jgi:protein-arginine kinase activator protein McsA